LHRAIDVIVDQYEDDARAQLAREHDQSGRQWPAIVRLGPGDAFTYRWPADEGTEQFTGAERYEVRLPHKTYLASLAWTTRPAWGRGNRRRAIVFGQAGSIDSPFYPWTEFVETDAGLFAAPIPDPARPRAILKDVNDLPEALVNAVVQRTDELFDQVAAGPSLRLVLAADNGEEMVRHGFWVASLRGRL